MSVWWKFRRGSTQKALLLMVVTVIPIGIWYDQQSLAQTDPGCPVPLIQLPNVAPFYGKKTCPIVGHIGNIKLAIPQNYILGPIAYKGVDIWNAESYKNIPKHLTLDTEIDNFAIRIRLDNFRPIESRKDSDDYDKLGKVNGWKQPPENRWVYVGIKTDEARAQGFTQEDQFNNWINGKILGHSFEKSEMFSGLLHYATKEQPFIQNSPFSLGFDPKKPFIEKTQYEVFFDAKSKSTFIECENKLSQAPPFEKRSTCRVYFSIPDLKIIIDVQNINFEEDLARWPEIEQGIRQLVQSFVVL